MNSIRKLQLLQARLGKIYSVVEDRETRAGLEIAQEGLQTIIYGQGRMYSTDSYDLDRIRKCTESLKLLTDSTVEKFHLPEIRGSYWIVPGASFNGALVYEAISSVAGFKTSHLGKPLRDAILIFKLKLELYLRATARICDSDITRVWKIHKGDYWESGLIVKRHHAINE